MNAIKTISWGRRIIAAAKRAGPAGVNYHEAAAALADVDRLAGELATLRGDLATIVESLRCREAKKNGIDKGEGRA